MENENKPRWYSDFDKLTLVYTETAFETAHNKYLPFEVYRHLDEPNGFHMVNGEVHSPKDFDKDFKFWHDKIVTDWTEIGLVKPNGKPLSKTALFNVIQLTKFSKGAYMGSIFMPNRVDMYQFNPYHPTKTKAEFMNVIYSYYIDMLNGQMGAVDGKMVNYGNTGIPLSWGEIEWKEKRKWENGDKIW